MREVMKRTATNAVRASSASLGKYGDAIILLRLIEIPTKTSPVNAAAAPNSPTKKFSHPFIAPPSHGRSSCTGRESSLILLGWYIGLHVVPTLRDAGTQHTAFV